MGRRTTAPYHGANDPMSGVPEQAFMSTEFTLQFQSVPLWSVYGMTLVTVALSVLGGFRIGKLQARGGSRAPAGSIVGALLGLLAFMLAFTFGMASSRFDERK